MSLTPTQSLMLFALGEFYKSINQPLVEKPVQLRTSKIAFIELLLQGKLFGKQERAIYKNLEVLEQKKLINYENHLVRFTETGLQQLEKINREVHQFLDTQAYFSKGEKPKRKLQTVMRWLE